jgi:sporulation protein YlmC with PRC-barrel domain
MTIRNAAFALTIAAAAFGSLPAQAAPIAYVSDQKAGEWMSHRLVGTKVLSINAEEIGDIKDVIVDAKGTVTAVVIGVGGWLGIPEKLIGVPFSAIHIGDVVQSSRVVVLDASKEDLKAAPAFKGTDPATTDRVKQKATDWATAAKAKVMEKAKQLAAPKDPAAATPAPATKP